MPPLDARTLVEADQEPLRRVVIFRERPPAGAVARPGDMARALPVAGLAANADLCEARGEAIIRRIVVLAHAGRVALRAHEVPVLVQLRPMQGIVVLDLLIRVEMEPALAALFFRPAVPGDGERLHPAVRELDEILLQRIDTKCVFHFEGGELAVRAVGLDEEPAILP